MLHCLAGHSLSSELSGGRGESPGKHFCPELHSEAYHQAHFACWGKVLRVIIKPILLAGESVAELGNFV